MTSQFRPVRRGMNSQPRPQAQQEKLQADKPVLRTQRSRNFDVKVALYLMGASSWTVGAGLWLLSTEIVRVSLKGQPVVYARAVPTCHGKIRDFVWR